MLGVCFVGVGRDRGGIACFRLVGCLACMASLMDVPKYGALRSTEGLKKEERQDFWIVKLIRGLTAVARMVPLARAPLYQLIADLCTEERR